MHSTPFVTVSCFGGFAASLEKDGLAATLKRSSQAAKLCAECEWLEAEFLEARNRLRNPTRLRRLTALEEKQLIDRVAMAIARMKEHEARHSLDRCKKELAEK